MNELDYKSVLPRFQDMEDANAYFFQRAKVSVCGSVVIHIGKHKMTPWWAKDGNDHRFGTGKPPSRNIPYLF